MYSNSAVETRGWLSGLAYIRSQKTSQMNPMDPHTTNVGRHASRPRGPVKASTRTGTTAAGSMLPTLAPELKMLVARARSFLGNHSATVLIQAGKLAASQIPRRNMAAPKCIAECAKPGNMAAVLHNTMAIANALRVPSQSVNHPATTIPIPYPHLKAVEILP